MLFTFFSLLVKNSKMYHTNTLTKFEMAHTETLSIYIYLYLLKVKNIIIYRAYRLFIGFNFFATVQILRLQQYTKYIIR